MEKMIRSPLFIFYFCYLSWYTEIQLLTTHTFYWLYTDSDQTSFHLNNQSPIHSLLSWLYTYTDQSLFSFIIHRHRSTLFRWKYTDTDPSSCFIYNTQTRASPRVHVNELTKISFKDDWSVVLFMLIYKW